MGGGGYLLRRGRRLLHFGTLLQIVGLLEVGMWFSNIEVGVPIFGNPNQWVYIGYVVIM